MLMEKNPERCGQSNCIDGIYICRLLCLPCARAKKCALDTAEELSDLIANMVQIRRREMENQND